MIERVLIARCPEHGLHGEREECFACGGPVERVAMVEASALAVAASDASWLFGWAEGAELPEHVQARARTLRDELQSVLVGR